MYLFSKNVTNILTIGILIVIIYRFWFKTENFKTNKIKIKIEKHLKTFKEKQPGLMFRKHKLDENTGYLFDYSNNPSNSGFWMKNTYIPLDIIFLDHKYKIIGFLKNMKPQSLESRNINKKYSYAIEVNDGTIDKLKLDIGDHIDLVFS